MSFLGAIWAPAGSKMAPKISQKFDRGSPGDPPGGVPEPTMYPNSFLEASATIFSGFLMVFGRFLDNFWVIFCRILDEFGRLFPGFLIGFPRLSTVVFNRFFNFFDSYYPCLYVVAYKHKQT